jgi:hypothetical protein
MKTTGELYRVTESGTGDELLEKRSFLWHTPGHVMNFLSRNYELEHANSWIASTAFGNDGKPATDAQSHLSDRR